MLRLSSKITINEDSTEPIIFDFVNEVEIDNAWDNLTDTAKVVIPYNLNFKGKAIAVGSDALFKRGDKIKIELGYDDVLKEAFNGYISKVNLSVPITLECEDKMWELKSHRVTNIAWSSVSLTTLLKHVIPSSVTYTTNGFTFENLGQVRISNSSTATMVLKMLRDTYQIYSWFRGDTLYIGLAYQVSLQTQKNFGFESNIIEESGLDWENSEDISIRVKGISIQSDNTKLEYYYPSRDSEGQQMEYKSPNLSQTDLETTVKRYYNSFFYSGFKGNFKTFGEPFVNHGDVVSFTGNKLPERNEGKYLVKGIKRTFGQSGYKQVVELGNQITE
jgi:hypothetical protein